MPDMNTDDHMMPDMNTDDRILLVTGLKDDLIAAIMADNTSGLDALASDIATGKEGTAISRAIKMGMDSDRLMAMIAGLRAVLNMGTVSVSTRRTDR